MHDVPPMRQTRGQSIMGLSQNMRLEANTVCDLTVGEPPWSYARTANVLGGPSVGNRMPIVAPPRHGAHVSGDSGACQLGKI